MNNNLFLLLIISLINLTSCELTEISKVSDPTSPILLRETPITKELACLGDMLTTYKRLQTGNEKIADFAKLIPIAVISVVDKTSVSTTYSPSEIPLDLRDMTIGTVAKIGGVLRLLHVPESKEYEIASYYRSANNIPSMINNSFFGDFDPRYYKSPTVLIYGSLTEYDRTLQNYKTTLDGKISTNFHDINPKISYGDVKTVSRMTIDFRAVKLNEGGIVSNESIVTNTILLYIKEKDASFAVGMNGISLGLGGSIGYADNITEVDARHAALRLLIERSIMEVLGKIYMLPYWRCFTKVKNVQGHESLVVQPNDPTQLSDESIKMLTGNVDHYLDSMIDKKSFADLDVINAIKRYFEQDDYLNKNNKLVSFFKRPAKMPDPNYLAFMPDRIKKITNTIESGLNIKKTDAEKNTNKSIAEIPQERIEKLIRGVWLENLRKRLPLAPINECGQYYFKPDSYYDKPIPLDVKEELNPYLYVRVDTKKCLFNRVMSAYHTYDPKFMFDKYKIYGMPINDKLLMTEADFFANIWINIPVEANARWKY
jgi:hypothetical protein